jgi:hypothetical protein
MGGVYPMNKGQRHYLRRRAKTIAFLGGKCAECGAIENLEFDHIDPAEKSFSVAPVLTHSWEKIESEIKKCQLLCKPCHALKTIMDKVAISPKLRRPTKGSLSRFTGVDSPGKAKGYRARIRVGGDRLYLGTFATEEEAAIAYNEAAEKYLGEAAYLNPV